MVSVILSALAILALSVSVFSQQDDPCLDVNDATQFRNDWSACGNYFWCRLAANGGTTPTTPCDSGLGFDEENQVCNVASATCDQCPESGSIAV